MTNDGKLTGKTWVPLAVAVGVLVAGISAAWAVRGALARVESQMATMRNDTAHEFNMMALRLKVIEVSLESATDDRYRRHDAAQTWREFGLLNPTAGLKMPEISK